MDHTRFIALPIELGSRRFPLGTPASRSSALAPATQPVGS
jgi:hypothetical protein